MFLIDTLLMSPFNGLLWVAREIQKIAQQEQADQRDALLQLLSELHRQLETGVLGDEQFEQAEQELLDRLDALQADNDNDPDPDPDPMDEEPDDEP